MVDPHDRSDITFNHTSNAFLTRLMIITWMIPGVIYLIRLFQV